MKQLLCDMTLSPDEVAMVNKPIINKLINKHLNKKIMFTIFKN